MERQLLLQLIDIRALRGHDDVCIRVSGAAFLAYVR